MSITPSFSKFKLLKNCFSNLGLMLFFLHAIRKEITRPSVSKSRKLISYIYYYSRTGIYRFPCCNFLLTYLFSSLIIALMSSININFNYHQIHLKRSLSKKKAQLTFQALVLRQEPQLLTVYPVSTAVQNQLYLQLILFLPLVQQCFMICVSLML